MAERSQHSNILLAFISLTAVIVNSVTDRFLYTG